MNRREIEALVSKALLAPSVHNVQPARWRIRDGEIGLFEDIKTRLPVADPNGDDASMSLGAALEGLALAASQRNHKVVKSDEHTFADEPDLRFVGAYRLESHKERDPLCECVETRRSWRGAFNKPTAKDKQTVLHLEADDSCVVSDLRQIEVLANLVDSASYSFMKDSSFRRELVSWMRLSRRHSRWAVDGLNAEAMQLSALEAFGVKIVLGSLFPLLDKFALSPKLLAERAKTSSATAIVIFHRPRAEDRFESGRHFYRLWLRMEQLGFSAAVLAALADNPTARQTVADIAAIPKDHCVISAFRVGPLPTEISLNVARRPMSEILI